MKPPRSRPRVLVVDDDDLVRRSLERVLRGRAEVLSAEGAVRALELLGEAPVDVVVSDHAMYGETGLSLLAAIAARCPGVVLVMFSARPPVEAYLALDEGLLDGLFHKPHDATKLVDFVLHGPVKRAAAAGLGRGAYGAKPSSVSKAPPPHRVPSSRRLLERSVYAAQKWQ